MLQVLLTQQAKCRYWMPLSCVSRCVCVVLRVTSIVVRRERTNLKARLDGRERRQQVLRELGRELAYRLQAYYKWQDGERESESEDVMLYIRNT